MDQLPAPLSLSTKLIILKKKWEKVESLRGFFPKSMNLNPYLSEVKGEEIKAAFAFDHNSASPKSLRADELPVPHTEI